MDNNLIIRMPTRLKARLQYRALKKQLAVAKIVRTLIIKWLDEEENK